jgi:hypothetical protein
MRLIGVLFVECSFRPTFDLRKRPPLGKKSIKIVEKLSKIVENCIKITKTENFTKNQEKLQKNMKKT